MTVKEEQASLDDTIHGLCKRVLHLQQTFLHGHPQRILIALAGVPGSGKSTISNALLEALPRYGVHRAAVIPMVSLLSSQQNVEYGLI